MFNKDYSDWEDWVPARAVLTIEFESDGKKCVIPVGTLVIADVMHPVIIAGNTMVLIGAEEIVRCAEQ